MAIMLEPVIKITDPDKKKSEKTPAQIHDHISFDSRIHNVRHFYGCPLTYCQIRQYRRNPTAKLARWAILSQMIHTPWVPKNFRGKASQEMMDYLEESLTPLRNRFLMQSVFGTLDFGWQPFEVVWKPEDGYVYIHDFKALLQDFTDILVYVDSGQFAGFTNETFGFSEVDNSANKILEKYALNTNFEFEGTDWYGESVYECLAPHLDSWNNVEKAANRYDSKIAGATWVIYYPVGKTPYNGVQEENDVIARRLLTTLESSGCLAIPDEIQDWMDDTLDREVKGKWRVELITADGNGQNTFIERQKYLDVLLMRGFGFAERSILEGNHGTKEDAEAHGDISLAIIDTRHRLITTALNLYTIPHALEINFGKKMAYEAGIEPAPLVDSQFALIKDIYRVLLQNPRISEAEIDRIDMKSMKTELGIPHDGGKTELPELPEKLPQPVGKVPKKAGAPSVKEKKNA